MPVHSAKCVDDKTLFSTLLLSLAALRRVRCQSLSRCLASASAFRTSRSIAFFCCMTFWAGR